MTKEARVNIAGGDLGPIALGSDQVIYPFGDNGSGTWTKVGVLDLTTVGTKVIARSDWPSGLINWAAGTSDWVTWVDQSARQSDSDPNVLWRVWARNSSTGKRRLLSSNGNQPDPFVPQVHAHDGYVFWTEAEPDRTAREIVWKTGGGAPRSVLRHVQMTPGSETVADGQLVYLGEAAGRHKGHTVGGDCWTVPLDGHGSPKPITHTALAMGCAASDGWLVWSQHIDPHQHPLPPDGVLDDPYQIISSRLDGTGEKTLHRGYLSTGYPVVGDNFATWQAGSSVMVRALSSSAHIRLPGSLNGTSARAGDGNRLAYTANAGGSAAIYVVRIAVKR